jgi:septal ring factor EnvC (AmiA/AmiB activator)
MWNMMCDVMPTISEDSISQRSSQFSGEDANFEQLMVSMLDERDKLMDSLREAQERLSESEAKLSDVEKERDSLQRQINANLPQVRAGSFLFISRFVREKCSFWSIGDSMFIGAW